jgi:hypothetical protein
MTLTQFASREFDARAREERRSGACQADALKFSGACDTARKLQRSTHTRTHAPTHPTHASPLARSDSGCLHRIGRTDEARKQDVMISWACGALLGQSEYSVPRQILNHPWALPFLAQTASAKVRYRVCTA